MTRQDMLYGVRAIAITQFIGVLFFVAKDGITPSDHPLIASSLVLGLLFDGFSNLMIKYGVIKYLKTKRNALDFEFDQVMNDLGKKDKDKDKNE